MIKLVVILTQVEEQCWKECNWSLEISIPWQHITISPKRGIVVHHHALAAQTTGGIY